MKKKLENNLKHVVGGRKILYLTATERKIIFITQ